MAPARSVLGVVLSLLLAACSCNNIGCGLDIRLGRSEIAEWIGSDRFTVEVCVESECSMVQVDDTYAVPWIGVPSGAAPGASLEIVVSVTAGATTRRARGTVRLAGHRPIGEWCPPNCGIADLFVEDGKIAPAPTGLLPSRDA